MKEEPISDGEEGNEVHPSEHTEEDKFEPRTGHGASPGKIFIGGLSKETTPVQFTKHFGKYGEITDSVIMKDRRTQQPRGFGFVTYADPSVVDTVIQDPHIINGKQVEIKRTIPKGAIGSKDFKTKKIFVGGIPTTVTDDAFNVFFSKYGEVKEHMIMRDHATGRSRGFGFVTFETEEAVDNLLSKGNKIDLAGAQVEIKKAEPKKTSAPFPPSKRFDDTKPAHGGGVGDTYGGYGGGFGAGSYRSGVGMVGRSGGYGGYGGSEFGGGYGGYGGSEFGGGYGGYGGFGGSGLGGNRDPALGYSGRYGGDYSRGYDMGGASAYGGAGAGGAGAYGGGVGPGAYGGAGPGAYGGAGEGYGGYGGGGAAGGFGGGYDSGLGGAGYGSNTGAPIYGNRAGFGGSSGSGGRYHPYAR